jgi:hypothetical protein
MLVETATVFDDAYKVSEDRLLGIRLKTLSANEPSANNPNGSRNSCVTSTNVHLYSASCRHRKQRMRAERNVAETVTASCQPLLDGKQLVRVHETPPVDSRRRR